MPLSVLQLAKPPTLTLTTHLSTHRWVDGSVTPTEYSKSPLSLYCTGVCRDEPERDVERKADVVRDKNSDTRPIANLFL